MVLYISHKNIAKTFLKLFIYRTSKITDLVTKPYAFENEITIFSKWFRDQMSYFKNVLDLVDISPNLRSAYYILTNKFWKSLCTMGNKKDGVLIFTYPLFNVSFFHFHFYVLKCGHPSVHCENACEILDVNTKVWNQPPNTNL